MLNLGNREQKRKKTLNTTNKKLSFNKDTNSVKQDTLKINLSKGSTSKVAREDKNCEEIKSYDKQLIAGSGKLMTTKNFLVINKNNIKNKSEINKHNNNNCKVGENTKSINSMSKVILWMYIYELLPILLYYIFLIILEYVIFSVQLRYTKSNDRFSATSTSELKYLIQKVSSKSNNSFSDIHSTKCPSHEDVISQSKYERNFVTIDVVDSINAYNIPGEIIKPLKIYHTYLNTEFSKKSVNNEKRQKMANKFLMEFNETVSDEFHTI